MLKKLEAHGFRMGLMVLLMVLLAGLLATGAWAEESEAGDGSTSSGLESGIETQAVSTPSLRVGVTDLIDGGSVEGATFDSATRTLTLDNFTYTDTSTYDYSIEGILRDTTPLKIVLKGTNTIHGLSVTGNCEISGDGTLVTSMPSITADKDAIALLVKGKLTINGGTITASADRSEISGKSTDGILCASDMVINGGTINATGTNTNSIYKDGVNYAAAGIGSEMTMTINGGSVTAKGTGPYYGLGIRSAAGLTINGGTVSATGESPFGDYHGMGLVSTSGTVAITGGDVTGYGIGSKAGGIYSKNAISIADGLKTEEGTDPGKLTSVSQLAMSQITSDDKANPSTVWVADKNIDHIYADSTAPVVKYQTYVQNNKWSSNWITGPKTAGSTGQGLRMEAIKAEITDASGNAFSGLGISYKAHVQNQGWLSDVSDGAAAGTPDSGLRIEALQMSLTGDKAANYDVYYRVHVQNIGWMNWTSNGAIAGTTGYGFQAEAIQVVVVAKGAAAPAPSPANATDKSQSVAEKISALVHGQDYGWTQGWQTADQYHEALAGSTGQGLRLEAIRLTSNDANLKLKYKVHVQNTGWMDEVSDGQVAGTTGQGLRLEAIQITASGDSASKYDIYYKVHVQNQGWNDWVKNGEQAGTTGLGLRIEAIQIKVVEK